MTTISVVIPALNDAAMVERCLVALAAQSRQADEIIVVDNGSTDDTAAVALAGGARVVQEPVRGIPAATAAGFDAAIGSIIARIDADSYPSPDWIDRIYRDFARDPELSAVTGNGVFYGSNAFVHWIGRTIYIGGYFWSIGFLLAQQPLFGSNFAMRATTWDRLAPGFHRNVREIHDDLDLSMQLAADMTVLYDRELKVGVSARPFGSFKGMRRRLYWVWTTLVINWRERSLLDRRAERIAWLREQRRSAEEPDAPLQQTAL